jgi:hypothetical protein
MLKFSQENILILQKSKGLAKKIKKFCQEVKV